MTSPNDATEHPKPVVEPSPVSADPVTRALKQRIRQQEILAELGVVALQRKPFLELLNETVRLTAEGIILQGPRIHSSRKSPPSALRCGVP